MSRLHAVRALLMFIAALLLLAGTPAHADDTTVAEFLVRLSKEAVGDNRSGTFTLRGATPEQIAITIIRHPRTGEVTAARIRGPVSWRSHYGFLVHLPAAAYDRQRNLFYGGATLSGGGLPCPMRVDTLCFNARGIQSMRGLELTRDWVLGGIVFVPTGGSWSAGALRFVGTLDLHRQPRVEVTLTPRGVALRGPLAPWFSLTGGRLLDVTRLELIAGRILASGTFVRENGALASFTRRWLKPDSQIEATLPPWKPAPRPPAPGRSSANGRFLVQGRGLEVAAPRVAEASTGATRAALVSVVAPAYPLLHAMSFTAGALIHALTEPAPIPAMGWMPQDLAQADPLLIAQQTFEFPGSFTPPVVGPGAAMQARMTAALTWGVTPVVPTGYVTLGPPANRVYFQNAPLNGGQVSLDAPTPLSWQNQYASVRVLFPGGGTYPLKLGSDLKLTQAEDFWGKRKEENGKADPLPWFFTSSYEGANGGFKLFGQETIADRVQANTREFGQWFTATLKDPVKVIDFGGAYFAIDFGNSGVKLYYALLNPQNDPQNGLLFSSHAMLPGIGIYAPDGSPYFEFTSATKTKEYIDVLLRYTSRGYCKILVNAKPVPIVSKGIFGVKSPVLDLEYRPAGNGVTRASFDGTAGFTLEVLKIFVANCRLQVFYFGSDHWGFQGKSKVKLKLWKLKIPLAEANTILNFGKGHYVFDLAPSLDLGIFAVKNLSIQLRMGKDSREITGGYNDENWTLLVTFSVKILFGLKTFTPALVVWSDGYWELNWGGKRVPPLPDNQKEMEWEDTFHLFGAEMQATIKIQKSKDGLASDTLVKSEPKAAFTGTSSNGDGTVKVRGLEIPDPGDTPNCDPSTWSLLPGATVKAGYDVEVVAGPYGQKVKITLDNAPLRVNEDGTASNPETVPVTFTVREGDKEVRKTAQARITMRSDAGQGGGMMLDLVYGDSDPAIHGKSQMFDFTWPKR